MTPPLLTGGVAVHLLANPADVSSTDIIAALVDGGMTSGRANVVADHALRQGIKPFTLWLWLARFGVEALSIVVLADVTQHDLLSHLSNGTAPDVEELRLFAAVNGFV